VAESDGVFDRLAFLEELVASLRPVILADHSDHGLQGMSGLVGQYRAALEEIEKLRAARVEGKGTVLDELKQRRQSRPAASTARTASGNKRR
jgi:hypothetical protein